MQTNIPAQGLLDLLDDRRSRAHVFSLLLLIIVGFLLRWYSLRVGHAYTFFTIKDEITALQYAFGFMAGDPVTYYLGHPALNQGQIPGPLWAMLVAGLYKLGGNSIEGAIFGMVLLNTLVIYFVYLLSSRMMSPRYSLFATLFYALSPWAIYYSAGLYNPMVLAFLGALLYLALWQTLTHDRARAIFWVVFISAAIPQFHMIGIFYYPAIVLLLLLNPQRTNLQWLVAGILAGFLLYVPYLIGEITHHWSNLHNVLHGVGKFSSGVLKVITIPIGMLTNHPGEWPGYTSAEMVAFADKWFGSYLVLIAINLVSFLLAILFLARFFRKFYTALRTTRFNLRKALLNDRPHVFIGILLVIPLLLYILTGKAYATRYSIFIFPILFLLPALYLASVKSQRYKHILVFALSTMFGCNIYLVLSFYADQNNKLTHSTQFMPAFYKLEALYNGLKKIAGENKIIEVDTSRLLDTNNKYYDITTNAITTYIALYQTSGTPAVNRSDAIKFELANSRDKVPQDAKVVYHDNGLFAYTRSPLEK